MIRVNGEVHPWFEGMTVADLIKGLSDPYPYPVVRINGQYVSRPNFDKTMIPENADIFLLPMIVGG
jgi:thiamine biosynthesis protein ThiS